MSKKTSERDASPIRVRGGYMIDLSKKETVPPIDLAVKFKTPPTIMKHIARILMENGHKCVAYNYRGKPDCKLQWCNKDICPDASAYHKAEHMNSKQLALKAKLEAEGHVCIEVAESFPCAISWCQKTPCSEVEKTKSKKTLGRGRQPRRRQ